MIYFRLLSLVVGILSAFLWHYHFQSKLSLNSELDLYCYFGTPVTIRMGADLGFRYPPIRLEFKGSKVTNVTYMLPHGWQSVDDHDGFTAIRPAD